MLLFLLKVALSLMWAVGVFVVSGGLWTLVRGYELRRGPWWLWLVVATLIMIMVGTGAAIWYFVEMWPVVVGLIIGLVGAVIVEIDVWRWQKEHEQLKYD